MIQHESDKTNGFTLVELIVALTIFSVGILVAIQIAISVQQAQRNNTSLALSNQAMRILLERVRNTPSLVGPCGTTTDFTGAVRADSSALYPTLVVNAFCDEKVYGLKRIELVYTYQVDGAVKTTKSTTYLGNSGLSQ